MISIRHSSSSGRGKNGYLHYANVLSSSLLLLITRNITDCCTADTFWKSLLNLFFWQTTRSSADHVLFHLIDWQRRRLQPRPSRIQIVPMPYRSTMLGFLLPCVQYMPQCFLLIATKLISKQEHVNAVTVSNKHRAQCCD